MPNIAVVNYGGGNTRSVTLALERFGATPILATNQTHIENADGLVFPGQGANDPSMRNLRKSKLVEPILRFVETGKPFLGVCLGLQLLFENSEEGTEPGLGIFKGTVKKLPNNLKIPHMGWNMVNFEKTNKSIFELPNKKNAKKINHNFLLGLAAVGGPSHHTQDEKAQVQTRGREGGIQTTAQNKHFRFVYSPVRHKLL